MLLIAADRRHQTMMMMITMMMMLMMIMKWNQLAQPGQQQDTKMTAHWKVATNVVCDSVLTKRTRLKRQVLEFFWGI